MFWRSPVSGKTVRRFWPHCSSYSPRKQICADGLKMRSKQHFFFLLVYQIPDLEEVKSIAGIIELALVD